MKLKEIKPGMVIHCKTQEEKIALLEEADRLGYKWNNNCVPTDCRMIEDSGMTIHFHGKTVWMDFKSITWSDKTEVVTEFSDLIIPEISVEEALQIVTEICNSTQCYKCPMEENCFTETNSDKKKVIEICKQWKSDHEKKEPEIEWFWKGYVVGGTDCKEADTEQEAMEWCENYVKEHPEAKCTYKHVCRVKEVK